MSSAPSSRIDTVVVGAGPAGIAVSERLAWAGHEHVVLERDRVGSTWRTQRWDGFLLNTPNWMTGLPGHPDAFGTAGDLLADLERRAAGLPVREGVAVRGVWRERGGGYLVAAGDQVLRCRHVVAASGAQRVPRFPAAARAMASDGIEHVHVGELRRLDALPDGGVLVVGSGQSGAQVAEELLGAGRRVVLATSRVGRAPRRHRGRDVTSWWRDMGRLDDSRDAVGEAARRGAQPLVAGGRTISLQRLARAGAELAGRLAAADGTRVRFTGDPAEHAAFADADADARRAQIDAWIARTGADAPAHEPDPAEVPLRPGEVVGREELDLRAAGIRSVVWATGFDGDFGWLRMPIRDAAGLPLHRGVTTAAPGLFVLGVPWLVRRVSSSVYGIERDAAIVAARILAAAAGTPAVRRAVAA